MDRRAFFSRGAGKLARAVTNHAAEKARENASRWIRPPFAVDEFDFLLACDRCGECIEACPRRIIFPLSAKLGVKVFNTPAMDLANHGCHMCEDWPCVQACPKDVLKLPEAPAGDEAEPSAENKSDSEAGEEQAELRPEIAKVFIDVKTCLPYTGPECGACKVCPVEGAMEWMMEKPVINAHLCTGCALCREACILEPKAIIVQSKYKGTSD